MDERTEGNVVAGWELARRLPWWTVWYGEHTGSFWAVPRAGHLSAVPHIEAATPQELERAARHIEHVVARRGAPPYGEPSAGEAAPFGREARGGPPGAGSPPPGRTPRGSR
ncbi:hypothetical protein [Streptosporangium sp. NPDC006007]|uniref:hypothetical protein n=1 Tax=Streptosporangium sp. NPDC006007 TaxID=3154575 RepID=UPI00339EF2DF